MSDEPQTPEAPDSQPAGQPKDPKKQYYLACLLAAKFLKKCGPDFVPKFNIVPAEEESSKLKDLAPKDAKPAKPEAKKESKKKDSADSADK